MKKLILALSCIFLIPNMCGAIITDREMTTPQQLINAGYSSDMADMVQLEKARATSTEFNSIKPAKRCNRTAVGRFFRRCLEYIDPALDDDSFYYHDTKMEPQVKDF